MKKTLIAAVLALSAVAVFAQTGTAMKEAGKATVQGTKEGKENVESAMTKEPNKSVHKAKAKMHKASAKQHRANAKAAAKDIGK